MVITIYCLIDYLISYYCFSSNEKDFAWKERPGNFDKKHVLLFTYKLLRIVRKRRYSFFTDRQKLSEGFVQLHKTSIEMLLWRTIKKGNCLFSFRIVRTEFQIRRWNASRKEGLGKYVFLLFAAAKMIWLNFWRFLKPKRMLMTYILTDVLRSKSFLFSRKKSTNCKMLSMKMRPSLKLRRFDSEQKPFSQ